jgi:hypothetical protein
VFFKIYTKNVSFVKKFFSCQIRTSKSKTFKPKKKVREGTKQYQLKQYAEATLGSGNLKLAVVLPEGEDINEWLAVNSKLQKKRKMLTILNYISD